MTISGHKTRSIFDRYNIVSKSDLHEAAKKLALRDQERDEQYAFRHSWARWRPHCVHCKIELA